MAWCEFHGVHYTVGLARNPLVEALIADELAEAEVKARTGGTPNASSRSCVTLKRSTAEAVTPRRGQSGAPSQR